MAKVKVTGNTITVVSDVPYEELAEVEKYRPKFLELKDEDGEPYFRVTTSKSGFGDISKYGISFVRSAGRNEAIISLAYNGDGKDIKGEIIESYGAALLNLKKVEANIAQALQEIADFKAEVSASVAIDE